jgi:hypothetical protein
MPVIEHCSALSPTTSGSTTWPKSTNAVLGTVGTCREMESES